MLALWCRAAFFTHKMKRMKKLILYYFLIYCSITTSYATSSSLTVSTSPCDTFLLKTQEVLIGQIMSKKQGNYHIILCESDKKVRLKTTHIVKIQAAPKMRIYDIWVHYMNEDKEQMRGYISKVGDSFITINRRRDDTGLALLPEQISIKNIKALEFKRGAFEVLGFMAGVGVSIAIGAILGDDIKCSNCWDLITLKAEHKTLLAGLFLVPGGTVVGSLKNYVPIKGKQVIYNTQKKRLAALNGQRHP